MAIRNRHKVGDHLAVCDESGIVDYASRMVKRWDGAFVRKQAFETRHPQDFIRAKKDPYPLKVTRPEPPVARPFLGVPPTIGKTNIPTPISGPGARLYGDGIGVMQIGTSFVVS